MIPYHTMKTRSIHQLGDTVDLLDDQDPSSADGDDAVVAEDDDKGFQINRKDPGVQTRFSYRTRRKARLGNTVDLLEDAPDDSNEMDAVSPNKALTQDAKQVGNVASCRQIRSKITQENAVDLSGEDTADSSSGVKDQVNTEPKHNTEEPEIGEVGYTFQKYFNQGWFTGIVVEIRPGAGK